MKPLAGIKVLDLSKVLAGPMCTQTLASLGADVIKVENCESGDESRLWAPRKVDTGAAFLAMNAGKRSIAVNLQATAGRAIMRDLAAEADVVVESFAPGVAAKLGVDRGALSGGRDRLIYCSISGFGQSGPMSPAPGYDAILQAYTGMMSLNGEDGGEAMRLPGSPIDLATGQYATQGILAALIERSRSGKGCHLDVSLFETAVKMLSASLQAYWISGVLPKRMGSGHPAICPYQVFQSSDRPILIAIANDKFWRLFCAIAGLQDYADDPRFRDNPARVKNFDDTIALVERAVIKRSAADWAAELMKAGIPAAPMNTLEDLLSDPHTVARGLLVSYDHPQFGPMKTVAEPILYDASPRSAGTAPPALGEHTMSILRELGYDAEKIAALEREAVIREGSGSRLR